MQDWDVQKLEKNLRNNARLLQHYEKHLSSLQQFLKKLEHTISFQRYLINHKKAQEDGIID